MSRLLWIAVPGGRDGGDALLRLLVVPEIEPRESARVADDVLGAWPAILRLDVEFAVELRYGDETRTITPERADHVQDGAWDAFFGGPNMMVTPPGVRRRAYGGSVDVTPTGTYAEYIESVYTPEPPLDMFGERVGPAWPPWTGRAPRVPGPPPREDGPEVQRVDFHRVIGLLREHPAVLRALGLIVDLRFPAAELGVPGTPGTVQVLWPGGPPAPMVESTVTRYETTGGRFLPESTPEITGGLVDLRRTTVISVVEGQERTVPAWRVTTFDVDAAVQQMPGVPGLDGAPLPPLRSAGLALQQRDRGESLTRVSARAASRVDASRHGLELTADDLVLGYRIDVRPEGGDWLSLCRRRATYAVGGITLGEARALEEGHVKARAAQLGADGGLYADEVVARWSGWSLAVPPPVFDNRSREANAGPRQPLPFDFSFDFEVEPGSLPQLRFGTAYQLRARVADLAGGGLELEDPPDDAGATDPVLYLRHEPVGAPLLSVAEGGAGAPGAVEDRLVLRDDGPGGADVRILRPPPSSPDIAEQHGLLDGPDDEALGWYLRGADLPDPAAAGVSARIAGEPEVAHGPGWPGAWPDLGEMRLELREDEPELAGSRIVWEGHTLVLRLAPAESVELELWSQVRPDLLSHFAGRGWLGGGDSLAHHPMLMPVRTVHAVHAVRRPRHDPAGGLQPVRTEAGQTWAALEVPADQPLLGVDPSSTVRLDVSATWEEPGSGTVPEVPVASVVIERGMTGLPGLRQEFGDTRHRRVSYVLTAVSRFREHWPASADESAFLRRTTCPPVRVPSSARPSAPAVLSARPAFSWTDETRPEAGWTVRHRTRKALVRVELDAPWFETGEGEQLAVLAASESPAPGDLWPYLSRVGADAIWLGCPLPAGFPVPQDFGDSEGDATVAALSETGEPVWVVPYSVAAARGRHHADVSLTAGSTYCPFAELAVARYQPNSLIGLELSPVVRTEMVPLLPERSLTVSSRGPEVTVRLDGEGPAGEAGDRVEVRVERFSGPPESAADVDLIALDAPADGIPAWVPLDGYATSGRLGTTLALMTPEDAGTYRVHVREVDRIGDDGAGPVASAGRELSLRTVFADVIVLGRPG